MSKKHALVKQTFNIFSGRWVSRFQYGFFDKEKLSNVSSSVALWYFLAIFHVNYRLYSLIFAQTFKFDVAVIGEPVKGFKGTIEFAVSGEEDNL